PDKGAPPSPQAERRSLPCRFHVPPERAGVRRLEVTDCDLKSSYGPAACVATRTSTFSTASTSPRKQLAAAEPFSVASKNAASTTLVRRCCSSADMGGLSGGGSWQGSAQPVGSMPARGPPRPAKMSPSVATPAIAAPPILS